MSTAKAHEYAEAFIEAKEASREDSDALIERLLQTVRRNNDTRKLSAIAQEIEARLAKRSDGNVITITSARALPEATQTDFKKSFARHDVVRFAIDPALHAGVRINKNGEEELDMSFARKLSKLFA